MAGTSERSVEQLARKQARARRRQHHNHLRKLRALAFMNGHGVHRLGGAKLRRRKIAHRLRRFVRIRKRHAALAVVVHNHANVSIEQLQLRIIAGDHYGQAHKPPLAARRMHLPFNQPIPFIYSPLPMPMRAQGAQEKQAGKRTQRIARGSLRSNLLRVPAHLVLQLQQLGSIGRGIYPAHVSARCGEHRQCGFCISGIHAGRKRRHRTARHKAMRLGEARHPPQHGMRAHRGRNPHNVCEHAAGFHANQLVRVANQ